MACINTFVLVFQGLLRNPQNPRGHAVFRVT
jgi:hypothetical protein